MKKIFFTLLFCAFCIAQDSSQTSTTQESTQGEQPKEESALQEASTSNSSQENTQAQGDSDQKPLTLKEKKSGFIIGVEALFGQIRLNEMLSKQEASNFAIVGGFFGGYQHYFTDSLGIRSTLSIHDTISGFLDINPDPNNTTKTAESVIAFWVGTQLDFLWDFFDEGSHTLGLNVGVGYNFELYHQRQAVFNNATNNPFNLPQIYQHNLYPNLGIHYYYNQHQMELSYRYIGTIASPKLASANGVNFKTKVDYTSFFNFAYSFRF